MVATLKSLIRPDRREVTVSLLRARACSSPPGAPALLDKHRP